MSKAKPPTAAQRRRWDRISKLGCIVASSHCMGRITIHHCGTGAGGRKDHDKVLPLCHEHHQGHLGIDGKRAFTKRSWQDRYGSEDQLMEQLKQMEEKQ